MCALWSRVQLGNNVFTQRNTRSLASIFENVHEGDGLLWWYVLTLNILQLIFKIWFDCSLISFVLFEVFSIVYVSICIGTTKIIEKINIYISMLLMWIFLIQFVVYLVYKKATNSYNHRHMTFLTNRLSLFSEGEVITCRDCGEIFKDRVTLHKHQLFSCNNSATDFGQHQGLLSDR